MTNKPNTTSEYGRSKSMDKRLRAMGKPEPTPPVDAPPAKCGENAGHLIAGHSWFTCVLPKGHEGEHSRGGNCFKHGEYVGNQCPEWPNCIPDTPAAPAAPPASHKHCPNCGQQMQATGIICACMLGLGPYLAAPAAPPAANTELPIDGIHTTFWQKTGGQTTSWKCASRNSNTGANDPQDCDWPTCGCDPYANKVIDAIQESAAPAAPPQDVQAAMEAWFKSLPKCVSYEGGCDGDLVATDHEAHCPMRGKKPATMRDAFAAGFAAAERPAPAGTENIGEIHESQNASTMLPIPRSNRAGDRSAPAQEDLERAHIDAAPEPLKRLGARLTELLDDDQWNNLEPLLLQSAAEFASIRRASQAERHAADDYVAWLYRPRENGPYITCSSDDEGAFKVYRWPAERVSAAELVRQPEVCLYCGHSASKCSQ